MFTHPLFPSFSSFFKLFPQAADTIKIYLTTSRAQAFLAFSLEDLMGPKYEGKILLQHFLYFQ